MGAYESGAVAYAPAESQGIALVRYVVPANNYSRFRSDYAPNTVIQASVAASATQIATFTYDGDGKQVKSVINGVTTYFVGGYYQRTTNGTTVTETKYYFAGASRIAMRTNGELFYLLSDHLGSISIVTSASGAKISEQRYKPWGETRFTDGTLPTKYQYTAQRSEMDSLGLYFYNARWMDPQLGRFIQADSIVPGGVQGLDRYAYVNNSPLNYTDPSGHETCIDDYYWDGKCHHPDKVDFSKLSGHVYKETGVSGQKMYWFYIQAWEASNGHLTIKGFVEKIMAHELEPYQNSDGTLNITADYKETLKQATANWYWGQNLRTTKVTNEAMLNWMAGFASAGLAYRSGTLTGTKANGLAHEVINYVYSLPGIPYFDPTAPSTFGNGSLHPGLMNASQGTAYDQYIVRWPSDNPNGNTAYILSACQVAYQTGDFNYVNNICK